MTIFVNCHIFKKNTEIVIYDKKKPMRAIHGYSPPPLIAVHQIKVTIGRVKNFKQ